MSNDLFEAKQKLLDKLGSNYSLYIQLLGRWFRGLISKDEFDKSARRLIDQNFVIEHNEFWLAFFYHCANSSSSSGQEFQFHKSISHHYGLPKSINHEYDDCFRDSSPTSSLIKFNTSSERGGKARCLPNKVFTHMRIYVIAWEMGLESADDNVSLYINLALHHFLKNIITELICAKTAFRLRENKFKYAMGVKPINPFLNNSLKIYSSNLEYDPYQIESNKMNSSLVDTYAYNDSLFPSRLYEAQALYEYACSTTTVAESDERASKKLRLSDYSTLENIDQLNGITSCEPSSGGPDFSYKEHNYSSDSIDLYSSSDSWKARLTPGSLRKLTLMHLLTTFLSNRTIIPSQSLYAITLERIITKLT